MLKHLFLSTNLDSNARTYYAEYPPFVSVRVIGKVRLTIENNPPSTLDLFSVSSIGNRSVINLTTITLL
ncbi:8673_t:CDS:2 [Paraglomus occultum]|uniref:8673_t:CDS:1 n=1 Tax=Paraglomus occultum TaxID=144539 RepID=A0A9N9FE07_9GLOM|nr:8673_t:CDS:2 [Paraglomus occultum]